MTTTLVHQGVAGAFSEAAALRLQSAVTAPTVLRPLPTFQDVVEAAADDDDVMGVLPVVNTRGGSVDTALAAFASRQSDVAVVGVVHLKVRHHLWTRPGVVVDDIQRVGSHPQALAQCQSVITQRGWATVDVVNTAVAAQQLSTANANYDAAVASERAGQLYGLHKQLADIHDDDDNTTSFLVLGKAFPVQSGFRKLWRTPHLTSTKPFATSAEVTLTWADRQPHDDAVLVGSDIVELFG